jgi:AraC family transcriptional activator of pyochelin receptor
MKHFHYLVSFFYQLSLMIMTLRLREINLIHQAATLLCENLKHTTTIAQLARKVELSEKKLKAGFKAEYNLGVYGYLRNERISKAKELLKSGSSVKQAGMEVGYRNESAFVKAFRVTVGKTPAVWLRSEQKPLHAA